MLHSRKVKHTCKLPIPEEQDRAHGLVPPSRDIQVDNINLENSTSQPIPHLPQQQATGLW